jgi:hypothetical protein
MINVTNLVPKDGDGDETELEDLKIIVTSVSNGWLVHVEDDEGDTMEVYEVSNSTGLMAALKEYLSV